MSQLQNAFTLAVLGILVSLSGNVGSYAQGLPAAGPRSGAQTPVSAQPATNQANPQPGLLGNPLPTMGASHVQAGIVGDIRLNNVLGVPTSHCGHVIDLLISNHLRKQMGYGVPGRLDESPLSHLLHGYLPGDLELQAVHLVSDAEAGRGPIYQVGVLTEMCKLRHILPVRTVRTSKRPVFGMGVISTGSVSHHPQPALGPGAL